MGDAMAIAAQVSEADDVLRWLFRTHEMLASDEGREHVLFSDTLNPPVEYRQSLCLDNFEAACSYLYLVLDLGSAVFGEQLLTSNLKQKRSKLAVSTPDRVKLEFHTESPSPFATGVALFGHGVNQGVQVGNKLSWL